MRNSKQTKQQQRPGPPPRVVQAPVMCGQLFVATDVEHVGTEGQLRDRSSRLGTSPPWILGTAVHRNLKERSPSERLGQRVLSPWEQAALRTHCWGGQLGMALLKARCDG